MLETRPDLLRKVALASKVLGVILLVIGVIGFFAGLTAGGNMPAIVTSLVKMAAFLILLTGIFFFIILYAIGDMVLVLLGISESARSLQEQLAKGAVARPTSTPSATTSQSSRTASTGSSSSTSSTVSAAPSSPPPAPPSSTDSETASVEDAEEVMRRATEQARRAAEIARRSRQQGSKS